MASFNPEVPVYWNDYTADYCVHNMHPLHAKWTPGQQGQECNDGFIGIGTGLSTEQQQGGKREGGGRRSFPHLLSAATDFNEQLLDRKYTEPANSNYN